MFEATLNPDGSSFDRTRYVKVAGICYSVRPVDEAMKVYWGPYHTIAEAQAVKKALHLLEAATNVGQGRDDVYAIHLEERVY